MTLAGMTPQQTLEHNTEHCKKIANRLDAIARGDLHKCPYCGHEVDLEELDEGTAEAIATGSECRCPSCDRLEQFEQIGMYDYLDDTYGIDYLISSNGLGYRAGRVMVACGGPNIYVDTLRERVELYWWSDRAEYPMSRDATIELDQVLEELYEMDRM